MLEPLGNSRSAGLLFPYSTNGFATTLIKTLCNFIANGSEPPSCVREERDTSGTKKP
ncbi:MAG: hypothetical protein BWY82_02851 [Verrucomicrobia bacterium ADurb.Bin474]|nr:MAG: hypothetical protein BWY82_02851 [Verrucomicrobia bacterium ADurb.Bin474]